MDAHSIISRYQSHNSDEKEEANYEPLTKKVVKDTRNYKTKTSDDNQNNKMHIPHINSKNFTNIGEY